MAKFADRQAEAFPASLVTDTPWGHHRLILDKLIAPAARLYSLRATAQFGWSRNVLLNRITAGAYERAVVERKTHNFDHALPFLKALVAFELKAGPFEPEYAGKEATTMKKLKDLSESEIRRVIVVFWKRA